jgi:RHS repeat-associated protein
VTITYGVVSGDIYTVAGSASGASGLSGDGGQATSALLDSPAGVSVDGSGDIYIADTGNNRVQEVAAGIGTQWGQAMASGYIYTVAGPTSGTSGVAGDGGPATSALLDSPGAVALDASGDIYVADTLNSRVQEVSATTGSQWGQAMAEGDVYTVSGSAAGASGDAGDGGPAAWALLDEPVGLAVGPSGDLYVADTGNNVVRDVLSLADLVAAGGPTKPKETAGGSNPSEPNDPQPTLSSSDVRGTGVSVDAATGELDVNVEDFSVPGRGEALDLTRTYSSTVASQATSPGAFGYGWTGSYSMEAVPDPTYGPSVMDVVQENGSVTQFVETATSSWVPPARVQATLGQEGNGDWLFTRGATDMFTFDPSGQLISESDLNGYTTTLSYNSSGQLTTVTGPAGRTLAFTYGPDGLVSEVTDPVGRTTTYAYDANDDLTSVTDVGLGVTTYAYNSAHQLTSVTDPLGSATTDQYDSAGQVTSQTGPMGRTTTWSYALGADGSGTVAITGPMGYVTQEQLADGEPTSVTDAYGTPYAATTTYGYFPGTDGTKSVTDADGKTTAYTYDANGNLISETDPLGNISTWAYNSLNEVTSSQTPLQAAAGVKTAYAYDADGNLLSVSTPLPGSSGTSRTTTYTYGTGCSTSGAGGCYPGDVQLEIGPDGGTTAYTYDAYGDETSVTGPLGNETTYTYNKIGERTSMVAPLGNVSGGTPANYTTTYTYDAYGDLVSTTDPAGHVSSATYDDIGDELTSTDALGNPTSYTYDADGELTKTTEPDATTTTSTYDADGDKTSSTDEVGNTTNYTYDPLGRELTVKDPALSTTTYTYDADGNKISETDPMGNVTKYAYDADDRLVGTTEPDGTTKTATYDADGNESSSTDEAGDVTGYAHDYLDQLTSQTDPMGNVTSYTYDPDGRKLTTTDPLGNVTTTTYDGDGDVTKVTRPDGTYISYAYDADGDKVSYTDAGGDRTAYAYNDLGEQVSRTDPDGRTTSYGYDADGRETTLTDAQGRVTTTTYNSAGEATAVSYSDGETGRSSTYTPTGLALKVTDATGTTTYAYDADGRATSITNGAGQELSYAYNADGKLSSLTYPNGKSVAYSYNSTGEEISLTDWLGNKTSFAYDPAGRLTTTTLPNGVTEATAYDKDGGVTSITGTEGTSTLASFGYKRDADEEPTSEADAGTPGPASQTYTYDKLKRVTSDNSSTYGYNAQSQLTTGPGGSAQSFDPAGQLCWSMASPPSGSTCSAAPTGATTYGLDQDGQRTKTTTPTSTSTYGWDQEGQLTSATTGPSTVGYTYNASGLLATRTQGSTSANFVWDPVQAADALLVDDGTNYYVYGPGALPTEQVSVAASTVDYYLHDQLGSTRLLTSSSGAVVGSWTYSAWGGTVASTTGGSGSGTTTTTPAGTTTTTKATTTTAQTSTTSTSTTTTTPPATTTSGSPASIKAVGPLAYAHSSATTLPVSPQAVGDLMALVVNVEGGPVSSVSGGGVTTWHKDVAKVGTEEGNDDEIWWGVVSTTGASTITVAYTGSFSDDELMAQEYSAGSGATWSAGASGSTSSSTSTVTFPSLTPSGPGQLYLGFAEVDGGAKAGSTSGFGYTVTSWGGNLLCSGTNVSTTASPTASQSGTGSDSVGALFSASGGATSAGTTGTGTAPATTSTTGATTTTAPSTTTTTAQTTTTATTPLLWAGQYQDPTTGLYYMRARWYDPATGEFLSVDPDFDQTLDAYGYADENPLDGTDPSGLATIKVTAIITTKVSVETVWTKKTVKTTYATNQTVQIKKGTKTTTTTTTLRTVTVTVERSKLSPKIAQTAHGPAKLGEGTVTVVQDACGYDTGISSSCMGAVLNNSLGKPTTSAVPAICTRQGCAIDFNGGYGDSNPDPLAPLYSPYKSTISVTQTFTSVSASCWEDIGLAVGSIVVTGVGYFLAPTGAGLAVAAAGTVLTGVSLAKGASEDC